MSKGLGTGAGSFYGRLGTGLGVVEAAFEAACNVMLSRGGEGALAAAPAQQMTA